INAPLPVFLLILKELEVQLDTAENGGSISIANTNSWCFVLHVANRTAERQTRTSRVYDASSPALGFEFARSCTVFIVAGVVRSTQNEWAGRVIDASNHGVILIAVFGTIVVFGVNCTDAKRTDIEVSTDVPLLEVIKNGRSRIFCSFNVGPAKT